MTCLISTNVLARGIDVPEVDLVINYDVPIIMDVGFKHPDYPNYLHRVGRTGRFGTDGVALSLYSDEIYEEVLELIEKYYGITIDPINSILELKDIMDKLRADWWNERKEIENKKID